MHTLNLNILFSNGKMLPEKILAKALPMLDAQIVDEIKAFLVKSMSPEGGFVNREGKPDLYYSLFGFFVSRALGMRKEEDALRRFTEKTILTVTPPSPDFFSGTILYGALHKSNVTSRALKSKLKQHLFTGIASIDYQVFMAMLALFYLKDYFSLIRLIYRFRKPDSNSKEPPSTILAASLVMEKIRGRPTAPLEKQLLTYYNKQGGFVALKNAPIPDLLST
nr:hypothetical protein [Bacteroidota bacterium]